MVHTVDSKVSLTKRPLVLELVVLGSSNYIRSMMTLILFLSDNLKPIKENVIFNYWKHRKMQKDGHVINQCLKKQFRRIQNVNSRVLLVILW